MYLRPSQIPALRSLSAYERIQTIKSTVQGLPFGRKAGYYIVSCMILVALFSLVLVVPTWFGKILAIFAVGFLYPLILMPVQIQFALPYLKKKDLSAEP